MFSYYGSKSKIVHLYPKPKHDKIIEPFAGSARYALRYWDKDVLLVDKYQTIIDIWKWLQQCTKFDILKLPKPKLGTTLKDIDFDCEEARNLYGFMIGNGNQTPRNKANNRSIQGKKFDYQLKKILSNLHKIKHWRIECASFDEIENTEATWFIDPPYQFGGEHYKINNKNLDYSLLSEWCISRNGQSIVCENTKADWLPFKSLAKIQGNANTNTTESIWCNFDINSNKQINLF